MTTPATVNIALWATNMGFEVDSVAQWTERLAVRCREAAEQGADLILMPEHFAETWLSFKPHGLMPAQEMAFLASQSPATVEPIGALSREYGIAIVAGSIPWQHEDGGITNRAWTFLPDGTRLWHDKLALTPGEQDPENWCLTPGKDLRVFEWNGLRCAVLICLDVEMPALSVLLARKDIDLLLVPSMTHQASGYSRVFGCAKARAVELMCAVAVVGCIGSAPGSTQNPRNNAACAVYLPCEPQLGFYGVHTQTELTDGTKGEDPLVIARDVPVGTIRAMRHGSAEVWPGGWDARHVSIIDETRAKEAAE